MELTTELIDEICERAEGVGLVALVTTGSFERKADRIRERVNALGHALHALIPEQPAPDNRALLSSAVRATRSR